MTNQVLSSKCGNWVRGKCAITNTVTTGSLHFVVPKSKEMMVGMVDFIEKWCDEDGNSARILLFGIHAEC